MVSSCWDQVGRGAPVGMDIDAEIQDALENPDKNRRWLYKALLSTPIHVRGPAPAAWAVTRPDTGEKAVPAFLSTDAAARFWSAISHHPPVQIHQVAFADLAELAAPVGNVVLEPIKGGLVIPRADLRQLAVGQIPGEFAAWLRGLGRLQTLPREMMDQLRQAQVHVITGQDSEGGHRLYLLSKSADGGSQAVACFSSPETLTQFASVRRLFDGTTRYGVALYSGKDCIRIAAEIGASIIIDPESAWETQLEPGLIDLGPGSN